MHYNIVAQYAEARSHKKRKLIRILPIPFFTSQIMLLCSVRPKPGFDIGNQNQSPISLLVFEVKPKLSVSNFSHVSPLLTWGYEFLKA